MDLGLKDKVAFVAGSSRGIGEGIATAFLREGARTVITGRDGPSLAAAKNKMAKEWGEDRVLATAGDLAQPDAIEAALEATIKQWGKLDCMVINVGSGRSVAGWDLPESEWMSMFERNLWTSVRLAQAAMKRMTAAKSGSIVFIASIAGICPTAAPLPYSAAKAALVSYSANLAALAAPHGIRVNCVAPGNILFPGGSWEKRLQAREQEIRDYIRTQVPQNRFGTVDEIADVVAFLSSERASFVTGACWTADGGQTRKW